MNATKDMLVKLAILISVHWNAYLSFLLGAVDLSTKQGNLTQIVDLESLKLNVNYH
jgi:hypothetical protein